LEGKVMPLSYRTNVPPVGLPHKDFTRPILMPEDLEPKQPRTHCDFGLIWSEGEIKKLRQAYKETNDIKSIAVMFPDRTYRAVKMKVYALGLFR
jgi:hypothetical protein